MDMKFASKCVLYAIGFITLGAMSVPAFANKDFNRGYSQGYRDGMAAQRKQDKQHGSTGRITIDVARYGTRNASCNPRDKLQKAVNSARNSNGWRRRFSVVANNQLCGDPAPNLVKRLDVSYRCDDGPVLRTQTREGDSVTLDCNDTGAGHHDDEQHGSTGRITIDVARYGSRNASCNPRDKLQRAVDSARNSDGWRRGFSIEANNQLCGDPAPNFVKRLDVSYRCDNGPVLRVQADEGDNVTLACQ